MPFYGKYTEELFLKFKEEAVDALIKAEGAEAAMRHAGHRLIKDVMEEVGLSDGMKFRLDGEIYVVGEPSISWGDWEPSLSCKKLTKKGTIPKGWNKTNVFVAGLKAAEIIKE